MVRFENIVNANTPGRFTGAETSFFDLGYHTFSNVYRQDVIEKARHAVARICRKVRPEDEAWNRLITPLSALHEHRNPGLRQDSLQGIPFLIGELPTFSEALKEFVLHQPLWDIAQELLGSDDVVYHFSNVTRKPAQVGPNLSWHRDYPNRYICPEKSRDFVRALIPLEGMNEENGCTEALPQSHDITDEEAIQEEKKKDFDLRRIVPLDAKAGDVVMIHSKLLHGGRENRSTRERNLVVIQLGVNTDAFLYWNAERFSGLTREAIMDRAPLSAIRECGLENGS